MKAAWPIAFAVSIVALCVTAANLMEDPRNAAMRDCTAGWHDGQKQVACAEAIFGGQGDE